MSNTSAFFGVQDASQPYTENKSINHTVQTAELLNTSGGVAEIRTYGERKEYSETFVKAGTFTSPVSAGFAGSTVYTGCSEAQANNDYVKITLTKTEVTGN